jgi:hypothetical protein
MPPHDAAAESHLKKSHPRACPKSLIAGDRLVLGLRAVSLTSVTCAWRCGLVKVREPHGRGQSSRFRCQDLIQQMFKAGTC